MTSKMHQDRPSGFTLIELLIVVGIIGTLAAVLLPRILETSELAKEGATEATMMQLENACKKFNRKEGYYPTDDLRYLKRGTAPAWKTDNGRNTGIESLIVMVSQSNREGSDLGGLRDQLVNTDEDQHGASLPLLSGTTGRMEIADAWGTPMVYFSKLNMSKAQLVVPGLGEPVVSVKAKRREDGSYYGDKRFQILSAGKDLIFDTEDDVVWPSN
jgi:prepilin-type N-terminal cleavage/methylation domain-containing protein